MLSYRCQFCQWFDRQHKSLIDVEQNLGYCRKHKPVIFSAGQRYYGGWPLVDENDWCGEYREDESSARES